MIKITRQEREILEKEYGVPMGSDGISHTHGHNIKYFLCESKYNQKSIKEIRDPGSKRKTK